MICLCVVVLLLGVGGGVAGSWVKSGKLHATPRSCMQQHVIATQKMQQHVVAIVAPHSIPAGKEVLKNPRFLHVAKNEKMQQQEIAH